MPFGTYSDLQASIASWLGRDDLTAIIPDFITLFEAAANRRLRVRQMETSATLTPTNGVATLPADYLSWRRVTWTGSPLIELEYVEPSWIKFNFSTQGQGVPSVFTIEGSNLSVAAIDDTALDFLYYQKIPALSGSLNWLYQEHPDTYLYGSLCECKGYQVSTDQLAMWKAWRDEAFSEIEELSKKTRGVGGMRVMGPTP